jgi:predicted nucleic acid-binding protein
MNYYYLDTSALVKLYVPERGSEWVEQVVKESDEMGNLINLAAISKIGIVEVAAAIARRERLGTVSTNQKTRLYRSFLRDSEKLYELLPLTDEILHLGAELTQRWPLRGYDAVHLASAYILDRKLTAAGFDPLVFLTADQKLFQASQNEGLKTENPAAVNSGR